MITVLVTGTFNVLHPGHLRLLRFAKESGDRLVVAVHSDRIAANASHVPEKLRLESIESVSWVDEAFIINEPIVNLIENLRPNKVVKGKEHELRINPELEILDGYGGELIFSSGETSFSSLDLIRKEFREYDPRSIKIPYEYMVRHGIDLNKLTDLLWQFTNKKVCVIGDLIIDEYITCQSLGMSQEDPTIVVTPIDSTRFIGGAGIVAAHAAGMGASVKFISVTGNDDARNFALEELSSMKVNAQLLHDETRPTTLKQRYRSQGKSMLRVSHLHQGAISTGLQNKIITEIEKIISDLDILVFSDFNYGCLPQPLVDKIIGIAKSHGVMVSADSQSSSQIGDISRFNNIDLLTPTEREARISTRNREDGLVVLAENLRQQASVNNILLKLGDEGLMIHAGNEDDDDWLTDRIDALNSAPKDVAGAGDSLLITSAIAIACGGTIWEAACLGSLAAAVQVGRVGNTPLQTEELLQELS